MASTEWNKVVCHTIRPHTPPRTPTTVEIIFEVELLHSTLSERFDNEISSGT